MRILIWADEPNNAIELRDKLRELEHKPMIRDAREFRGSADLEQTDALAFVRAGRQALILAEYRSPAYVSRFGAVRVLDIETGDFGEPIGIPDLGPEPKDTDPAENDLLRQRLDNLDDNSLRVFARGVLGEDIGDDATREDIEARLRQAMPGNANAAPEPEYKQLPSTAAEGFADISEAPPAPPEAKTETDTPRAATNEGEGATETAPPATPAAETTNEAAATRGRGRGRQQQPG